MTFDTLLVLGTRHRSVLLQIYFGSADSFATVSIDTVRRSCTTFPIRFTRLSEFRLIGLGLLANKGVETALPISTSGRSNAAANFSQIVPIRRFGLTEEAERSECRRAGAALVWNNRETEMANLGEVEPLFFALVGGSLGAEGVFLNQDLAVRSASILGDFHAHLLGALAHCFFDLVHEPRDRLGVIKLHHDLFDHVGARTDPTRGSGARASVQQVFDRVRRIL